MVDAPGASEGVGVVGVSVGIDRAALARLDALLDRVAAETPERAAAETRRAALYLCQGLKRRTRKAPKRVRQGEWRAVPSPVPPRYIHSRSGGLLRRWALTRKLGTSDEYTKHHFVYTKARRGRGGRMVGKREAEERRELLRVHGGISRPGLARASWGWIARRIYGASAEGETMAGWKAGRMRGDPRRAVSGRFAKSASGASADIVNALGYISAACPPSAVSEAADAAARRLEHNILNNIERAIG